MSNDLTILMPKILARGMKVLRQQCWMPRLVNGDYSKEFAKKGATVNIPVSVPQTAADVVPSNVSPAPANKTPTTIPLTLDYWKMTDFGLDDRDRGNINASENFIPMQVEEAFKALANAVNISIWAQYTGVWAYVGTAGTNPFIVSSALSTDTLLAARQTLHTNLSPRDNRRFVMDFAAEAKALSIPAFMDAEKTADGGHAKAEGEIGKKLGFWNFADDHVPTHTKGVAGTVLIDQADVAIGDTDVHLDGLTTKASVGDIFTVAGDTQTYVVVTASDLSTADGDITFQPAAKVAWANDAAVTFKATHVVNMAFHRDAFAFATRVLETDNDVEFSYTMQDPLTGLTCRMEKVRQHKQSAYQIDMLWGTKLIDARKACRVAG